MPVEGPISRGAKKLVAEKLTEKTKQAIDATLPKLPLGLGGVEVEREFVHENVKQLLDLVWGASEFDPSVAKASQALGEAAKTFVQPELSATERRAKLAHAAGDPLTDAVLGVLVDFAALVPKGALTSGGKLLAKTMGEANTEEAASKTWFAPYIPSGASVEEFGKNLDGLRARMREPEFRKQLSRALDVVRVLGRLEADNLEKIAVDVSPEKRAELKGAFAKFSSDVLEALGAACLPQIPGSAGIAKDLVTLGTLAMRASQGEVKKGDGALFEKTIASLGTGMSSAIEDASALKMTADGAAKLPERVEAAQKELVKNIRAAGAMSPAALAGLDELCKDVSAVVVTGAHLVRFAGAIQNEKIPEAERIELLKGTATDAGPVVVKLLQTFANQAASSGDVDSVAMKGLRELQENVPPMTEAQVRAQVEAGLGMKLEDAFVKFDTKPIASASIGQVHRAVIKTRWGGEREVVVKVQRPNLDVEFERATRVARLGLQFASELVKVLQEAGDVPFLKDLGKNVDPAKIMKLVEETVTSFVASFQIETDFDKERANLKQFRRDMKSHNYVTAPHVYSQWSSKTVLTMEYMKLEKLPSMIERANVARAQKLVQAATGPVTSSEDAKARAIDHAARAFGLKIDPNAVDVSHDARKGVYSVKMGTPHAMYPLIELRFEPARDSTTVIKHVTGPPIIKDDTVRLVRDRFLASLLSQAVVHGRVHGDPHKGNWGVLGDGQTIVMLDFGKMIDLEKRHLLAPVQLAWNWFRKDAAGMADAVLTMTEPAASKSGNTAAEKKADKRAVKDALVAALTEMQNKGDPTIPPAPDPNCAPAKPGQSKPKRAEPEEIIAGITAVLAQHGLGLASVYTQGIKAGFSFAGNFSGLADAGAGELGLGSWARASRIASGDAIDSMTGGVVGTMLSIRKNARVSKLNG